MTKAERIARANNLPTPGCDVRVDGDMFMVCLKGRELMSTSGIDVCPNNSPINEWEAGLLGEAAFAIRFGLEHHIERLEWGDGGKDFIVNRFKIDIKCARGNTRKTMIIVKKAGRSKVIPLKSHLYVSCYIKEYSLDHGYAIVRIVGAVPRQTIQELPDEVFSAGHTNKVLPWSELVKFDWNEPTAFDWLVNVMEGMQSSPRKNNEGLEHV